jgi:DNA-binding GntR family transcriptional regulator
MVPAMVDPRGEVPVYRQVAAMLRARIADGTWPPGAALPSEPDLAAEFAVGRDTVRDSLALLRAEGLIETRRGFRTRVREPQPLQAVPVAPGVTVSARMPTPEERRKLDIGDGVPVLVIGGEVYPADRFAGEGTSTKLR